MSEDYVEHLISVSRAMEMLDAVPVQLRTVTIDLNDAMGRVLAQDVLADRDYPAVAKSRMDGYAVRCDDVRTAPVDLKVLGEVAAGGTFSATLQPGEAVAIMTGAALPYGADGVVPVEETQKSTSSVRVLRSGDFKRYVAPVASDRSRGELLISAGTRIGPAQVATLASVGASRVNVFARPRASVISTGNEIVAPDAAPSPQQLRNSNGPMLAALLTSLGCEVVQWPIVRDDPAAIRGAIEQAGESDCVLITGGMSMGEYDFVPRVLQEMGVTLAITKVKIKPGKPFVFGAREKAMNHQGAKTPSNQSNEFPWSLGALVVQPYFFGLPGNPVSAFVCTRVLASRLIRRMQGLAPADGLMRLQLSEPISANGSRQFYQPGAIDGSTIRPLDWRGSADVFTLASASGLIIRQVNAPALDAGAMVDVLAL